MPYTATEWTNGDIITATKANNFETQTKANLQMTVQLICCLRDLLMLLKWW